MKRFRILRILSTLLLSVSVFAPGAFAAKKDQSPAQITINAPASAVRNAVIVQVASSGFTLDSESQSQIVLARPMGGVGGLMMSALASPPACSDFQPRNIRTVTLLDNPTTGTVVMIRDENEHASSLCRPARELLKGKKVQQSQTDWLQSLKTSVESKSTQPTAPVAAAQPAKAEESPR